MRHDRKGGEGAIGLETYVASVRGFAGLRLSVMMLALVYPAAAQTRMVELDPAHTEISFTLNATLHTVHGTFRLKTGTIRFDSQTGRATGLIVVDSASGTTGNRTRDKKMHQEVLESDRYPEIRFTPVAVDGQFVPDGESAVELRGIMKLCGSEHQMAAAVRIRAAGERAGIEAHFVVPYVEWGLKNPSSLLLRVGDQITMDVRGTGRLTGLSGRQ